MERFLNFQYLRAFIWCLILSVRVGLASGQNTIGLPNVTHFTQQDFNAGVQSWMMAQDRFGIMYFANTDGLMTYNGNDWRLFPLPNKTLVRSLKIADDGKIYAGGQDELGYYFPSENGTLKYHSMKEWIAPPDRSFADVWNVVILHDEIFFRCTDRIFIIDPARKKARVFHPGSEWSFMGMAGGRVIAQDKRIGLMHFNGEAWEPITRKLNGTTITSILEAGNDSLLITTLKDGVYLLCDNRIDRVDIPENINSSHIYTAVSLPKGEFALGTTSDGVYVIRSNGQVTRHFYSGTRLQNNNVLSLFRDKESNLWLGLDKGIDLLDYNSYIQTISPQMTTPAACYSTSIFRHHLFIATSDGVYEAPLNKAETEDLSFSTGPFTRVGNSGGQVWGLFGGKHHLLMGHNEGIYQIVDHKATPLYKEEGAWLFRYLPGTSGSAEMIMSGNYTGLHLLKEQGTQILDSGRVKGSPYESLRFLALDTLKHIIWSSHPYRGIFKMQMSPDMHQVLYSTLYTEKEGLPSHLNNYVYALDGKIVFCTDKGLYMYDSRRNRFYPDPQYKNIFGDMSLRLVAQDPDKNIWFVSQKNLGVAQGGKPVRYFPELSGKMISGFEFIYPMNAQNIFVGSSDGLVHINFEKYQQNREPIHLLLSKAVAIGSRDSILFNGYFTDKNKLLEVQTEDGVNNLPAHFNSFHFEYTATNYQQPGDFQYSFQLLGFDQDWSKWTGKKEKDYTNLSHGRYSFRVKTKDRFGKESAAIEYSFVIEPYWYQTNLAYLLYALAFFALLIIVRNWQMKKFEQQKIKFEKDQEQLQYLHQLEIEHNEREIINLQKEKLEAEVAFKNQELASTTMHLFKRGKLLSKLKSELMEGIKNIPSKEHQSDFSKLVKMLNEAEKQDQDWEQFSIHFDEVHNNFLSNLKHTVPGLTPSDLKICAYLKMNLSSKEIAQLLNISLKGVEVARYRLRKKLGIPSSQVNLYDFLVERGDEGMAR